MNPQNPVAPIMKSFPQGGAKKNWQYILGAFLVVLLGIGMAWMIFGKMTGTSSSSGVAPGAKVSSTEVGILDPKVKYDTAIGVVAEGGIGNEGAFHLVRDGGPSKYVYLTSGVVDLRSFIGKKVEIWGQTLASKKAGWLMDVAKVKIAP
jgi:hypothetical protein